MTGGRKPAFASATGAYAPKAAVGTAKALGPPAGANKYTYAERRTAAQTLRSHTRSNVATTSPEWLKKVECARKVLPKYGQDKGLRRKSSDPSNYPDHRRRDLRSSHRSRSPKLRRSESYSVSLTRAIRRAGFIGTSGRQCTADLYKQATSKLGEVYERANIVALDWCDVPSRPRARIWLSAAIKAPENILFMLQECNPHLPQDRKFVKVEEHEEDVNQAVLVLNKESVAPIYYYYYYYYYSTDWSLSREMRALGPAIEDVDISDTEVANVTVVDVAAVDVTKTSTNKTAPQ